MSDDKQRQLAVEPHRSVIVQAPAGSGKTTLLVERYLGLLGVVEAPEEILAITFTRKAAAEMRERILQFLDPDYEASGPHEQAALAKARAVADKVAEWHLLDNPQRLLIRTIDSFNHYLARTMPVASQLGPVPAPAENTRVLYREAARRVLARADGGDGLAEDVKRLLLWRDHRSQDIEDLLVALLGKREQWLRALGISGHPERADFERVVRAVVTDQLSAARAALDESLAAAGVDPETLLELLRQAAGSLQADGTDSPLDDCDLTRLPNPDPADLPIWRALGFALLTNTGTWRASPNKNQGFPPKSEHKERIVPLLDRLRDDDNLAAWIDRARALPEPHYGPEEWEVLASMIRVLEASAAELELVFAETGQSDFAGIGAAALRGLGDEEGGYTDLALYLDRRIRHILVDEYQDTNWGQYHLLEKLVGAWQPGEERSLFLVGDPMQSIYRFREAEVGLFMRTREHGIGAQAVESCRLTRNFRSRAEIVDWVNERLGPVFPVDEDISAGAVGYAPSEPGRDGGGRVEILARPDRVSEADALAGRLAEAIEARRDDPDFKAAIIVRARSHLADILPALARHGIGYRAVKLDPLLTRPVVQDLLAITRTIINPADTASLLALLRSPVSGLTLADLHALAGDGRSPDDPDALERLAGDGHSRAVRVLEALEQARDLWRKRGVRDLVEGLWTRLGGPQVLERPESERRDALAFLDTLTAAEEQGLLADWNAFMELLDEQFTEGDPPSEDTRLEILTMHGAKGLEWDLVALPGLDRGTGGNDRELLYWLPFTPESGEERVLIAPLRSAEQDDNTNLIKLIRAEQKQREGFEHQRLLYVAATRAREQLLLTASLDPEKVPVQPSAGSLLSDLWPTCGEDFVRALQQAPPPENASTGSDGRPDQGLRRVRAGWEPPIGERLEWRPTLPPREREVEIEFNWAGVQVRRIGTVLHRLLERVGQVGIEQFDEHQRRSLRARIPGLLKAMGTGGDELETAVEPIREAFDQTLESETGRWILSGQHREAACELPLSGIIDGELVNAVIDRTFIDEHGTRWIIDYKSGYHGGGDLEGFLGEEAERYNVQLETYRKLFAQMGETDIKAALYLPRHDQLVVAR
ncbi:UvrD-helicase domain-containing protein [Wenzhouxiangella sp. EGI_FJ10409]|uniref:UvrD-helicase domain-containing protein n=1 Tax=Wenzhouxiangella sp. EGI_FJ10409 TaxID=3243767 RepID=UPI0035E2ED0A